MRKKLSDRYQLLRQSVKGKDALTRILFKLTRMLFYELVKEFTLIQLVRENTFSGVEKLYNKTLAV